MNYNAIMRIPRFYCPDISSDVLEIHDQKIIHHLIKVLRARQGQSVVLFDGNGKTFECEIKEKIDEEFIFISSISNLELIELKDKIWEMLN